MKCCTRYEISGISYQDVCQTLTVTCCVARKAIKKQKYVLKELREMFHSSAIFDIERTTAVLLVSCWSLFYGAVLRTRADSLRSHV